MLKSWSAAAAAVLLVAGGLVAWILAGGSDYFDDTKSSVVRSTGRTVSAVFDVRPGAKVAGELVCDEQRNVTKQRGKTTTSFLVALHPPLPLRGTTTFSSNTGWLRLRARVTSGGTVHEGEFLLTGSPSSIVPVKSGVGLGNAVFEGADLYAISIKPPLTACEITASPTDEHGAPSL